MDPESTQLQQTQLAAILGPDPSPFETLISHLMSSSNEQRSQAELIFNLCKQNDPDSLSLKLAHILQYSPHAEARAMSAILLRKQLTRLTQDDDDDYLWPRRLSPATQSRLKLNDDYLWPRLSAATQSRLKSILLACVKREDEKTISKKLCDTVSELASGILPENGWPELLSFVFECADSDSPKLQESASLIFAQLSQCIGETLIPHIMRLHGLFLQCLSSSSSSDVKIAALSAAINFIRCWCWSSPSVLDRFQDLLPPMMRTLEEALNCGQETTAQEALVLWIELAETGPTFFRQRLVDVSEAMLQIVEAESHEEGTRHLAIEVLITLSEYGMHTMENLPLFINKLFAILMKMLLDIEDDPAWHSAESEDEDAGETSNYSVGRECLDRLAISMERNAISSVALTQLPVYLAAPEWQKHHAALIALAQIADGCSVKMIQNLEQVVTMVLNSCQDPHPRVRWAAINAIGQLSTDLGSALQVQSCQWILSALAVAIPDLQVQYHQRVLPALALAMDDFQNPRVQAHAVSTMLKCSRSCTPDISGPHLKEILWKLLVLLPNGKEMVLESLTAFEPPLSQGMILNLERVVTMVFKSFQHPHPHPRVRWAVIAIGQLSTNLFPDLQDRYCEQVLHVLAIAMDFQNPRVQAHAVSTMLKFSRRCTPDILRPYLKGILRKLLVLLQNGEENVLWTLVTFEESLYEVLSRLSKDEIIHDLEAILVNGTVELEEWRWFFNLWMWIWN